MLHSQTNRNSSELIRTDPNTDGQQRKHTKQIQKLSKRILTLENCPGKSTFDKVQTSAGTMPKLGRPTLATLESTAFSALGFGAVNGQDFRTRCDPLGRFTLFLISQLVSGSRVSLTQGRAGPAGVETAGREHGPAITLWENRIIYRIKQVCRTTMPTCFWILVVSSPTCLWWKRGPVGHFLGKVPQRSGQLSIGKLTCQNLRQYTVNTNLRPNGHTRAYSPGKQNLFSNRGPLPSNRLTQSQPFHVHPNQQTTSNRPTKKNGRARSTLGMPWRKCGAPV